MPGLTKNVLSAGAGYQAGKWGEIAAEATLDFHASVSARRGIDLNVGAGALVRLDGAISQYLAVDVNGEAHAAASVRAQVQVPMDLFAEAGLAVRLQALAEAAAGITLAVGLSAEDFIALAEHDPRMRGAALKLLRVFLEELEIQGGVMAKAAAAAMAYVNVAMTGRLVDSNGMPPGFTIAAEAGVGLKAGAGFRVFARFGVADPRRLVRRSVDLCVDETLAALRPVLGPDVAWLTRAVRGPAKIGLRAAFELGLALAASGPASAAGDPEKLASRCVQVVLEEVQRLVLEQAVAIALERLQRSMIDIGFTNARWNATRVQRETLAAKIDQLPAFPFEATDANRAYWLDMITQSVALGASLAPASGVPPSSIEGVAVLWAATQLLFVSVARMSEASARVSLLGQPARAVRVAFTGNLTQPADTLKSFINQRLSRPANTAITQADAVDFLVDALAAEGERLAPEWMDLVFLVAGPGARDLKPALKVVLGNAGAFIPNAAGDIDPAQNLRIITAALQSFFDSKIEHELRPALLALTGDSKELGLYADEVLVATLRTMLVTVFDQVVRMQTGAAVSQDVLRELCSSLVMNLFGRSVVVTGDVLLNKALETMAGSLRDVAAHVNDTGGLAPTLAGLTTLDRDFVAELVEETLLVCSDTFVPLPEERRQRIRELLYEVINTAPPDGGATALEQLKNSSFVPNQEAATELAFLLGEEIAGNFVRFISALLTRLAAVILDELRETIADIQRAVTEWIEGLVALARELGDRVAALLREIERLTLELEQATDEMLVPLSSLLNRLHDHQGSRDALRRIARDLAVDEALGVLRSLGVYKGLPREAKTAARDLLRTAVDAVLNTGLFDTVLSGVAALGGDSADVLDELRAIEPGDDVGDALMEIFLDRLEDAVRLAFGEASPRLTLAITVPIVNVHIDLGRVRVPLDAMVRALRSRVRDLQGVRDRVAQVATAWVGVLDLDGQRFAAEEEQRAVQEQQARAERQVAESHAAGLDVQILKPAPSEAIHGSLTVELVLPGAPRSLVEHDELTQQRLFLWINHHEIDMTGVVVRETGTGTGSKVSGPSLTSARWDAHAPATVRARATTFGTNRRTTMTNVVAAPTTSVRADRLLSRSGQTSRRAGRPALDRPAAIGESWLGRPMRPVDLDTAMATSGAGLHLSISIPGDALHEGINTVSVVLAPGAEVRRIERAASFLWRPVTTVTIPTGAPPRGPVMPPAPTVRLDKFPPTIRKHLAGALKMSAETDAVIPRETTPVDVNAIASAFWFVPKARRQEVLERSGGRTAARLRQVAAQGAAFRGAIVDGALRPTMAAARPGRLKLEHE